MRILLLSVDFPPAAGGIQNLLANLASGLSATHDVSVIAPAHRASHPWDAERPYHVTRARRSGLWPWTILSFACGAFVRALRRPPDVVVCGHVVLGPASYLVARLFGAPMVVITHAFEIRAPRMRRLAGWTLRRAAMVVSVSEFTRRAVLAHGIAQQRVVVVHPGAAFVPDSVPDRPADASPVILTVARLGELYKGHDMLIRALPLVLARQPRARCVIVGDGPLRGYLERLAAAVGVADHVTFTGEVPDQQLHEWYRRASVFVLLSRESPIDGGAEGYGLTFIEAGAWGRPVIGGDSGGVPDAVIDGVTGLLVDPTDLAAIAGAVSRVLEDLQLAARLGHAGRQRAAHDLSWANVTAAFERVLAAASEPDPLLAAVKSARS